MWKSSLLDLAREFLLARSQPRHLVALHFRSGLTPQLTALDRVMSTFD